MPTAEQQLASVRKVLPQQFQKRFDKLWKKQKRELLALVGSPPEPKKVTAAQWKKWHKEQAAALLMLMLGYMLAQNNEAMQEIEAIDMANNAPDQTSNNAPRSPDATGRNPSGTAGNQPSRTSNATPAVTRRLTTAMQRNILNGMRRRANFAAESITRTTRNRLDNGTHPDEVLSDSRSRTITTTEMTAARSASVIGMYTELRRIGIECELVWRLRPCQHCEVCPLLDDTTHDYWSQFFPSGTPVHPNCCCVIELIFGSREQLLRRRRIKVGPPARNVWKAIQRAGFRVR